MQGNMPLSTRSKKGWLHDLLIMCLGDQRCPHAVQVALATDRVGTLGRDGAEIASQNVINAREVAAKAAEGLSMWSSGSGTPLHRGKGPRKRTDGTC